MTQAVYAPSKVNVNKVIFAQKDFIEFCFGYIKDLAESEKLHIQKFGK